MCFAHGEHEQISLTACYFALLLYLESTFTCDIEGDLFRLCVASIELNVATFGHLRAT